MRRQLPPRPWRNAISGVVAAWVLALAPAAHADSVSIPATGTIVSSCSLALASNFPAANFSANGNISATASVNCNTAFSITATSAKGAVKTANATSAGFINSLPYGFSLSVPLDSGGPAAANCTSAALLANSCNVTSGGALATNKTATLGVAWTQPALPTRLVGGSYTDTITLSIAATP